MNSKLLLTIAALGSAVAVSAQSGGSGGGGSAGAGSGASAGAASAGGATAAPGTGATTSGGTNVGSAGGSNIGVPSTGGVPNMSPTHPTRSAVDATVAPNGANSPTPTRGTTLPPGLTEAPAQPGISSVSGLPIADLPAVSAGTAPIGPQPSTVTGGSAATTAAGAPTGRTNSAGATTTTTSDARSGQANSVTGLGTGSTTVVPTPPPAMPQETAPTTPSNDPNQVWVSGHYAWQGAQWTWVEGTWQRPPSAGAVWVQGNYDAQSLRWSEGHWEANTARARTEERARNDATRR